MTRIKFKLLVLIIFFCANSNFVFAQCSDGGICGVGDHDVKLNEPSKSSSISAGFSYGTSGNPDKINFSAITLGYSFPLFKNYEVSVSLPFNFQTSESVSTNGIGDFIFLISRSLKANPDLTLSLTLGVKLPTGDVNTGEFLPQLYQNGLGSYDILSGISAYYSNFDFTLGFQLPLTRSENKITRLKRAPDIMLRAGHSITLNDFKFNLALIGIQNLGLASQKEIKSGPQPAIVLPDTFEDIPNSRQTQLNVQLSVSKPLSSSLSFSISAAVPLLKRDVNVDGLKRAFSISTGLNYKY